MQTTSTERLHHDLLTFWNNRDAAGMASLFIENGSAIGFDGTQMNGRAEIEAELSRVFADHKTAHYVWKTEEVRSLNSETTLLRAIVGMIPPGKKEINPATNAVQSLIAIRKGDSWKIALFQNTPAQFHGHPEQVEAMTKELGKLIKQK